MYEPRVHIYKSELMQRLLDAVTRGYYWHVSGAVPIHKASRLANKFAECYGVHYNANQRAYSKRKGNSNTRLYFFASKSSDMLQWWLLASAGEGAVHEYERLGKATDSRNRIRLGEDYELLRRTRKSEHGGGTVWSWRMTNDCLRNWRLRILDAARMRTNTELRLAIGSLTRTPGFSGIRSQVGQLVVFARAEWRRRHGSLELFPEIPRLPYVERLSNTSIQLNELIGYGQLMFQKESP